ncbi:MAG TPA: hypothetical protein VFZ61_16650 [Polyangiales bacterium]
MILHGGRQVEAELVHQAGHVVLAQRRQRLDHAGVALRALRIDADGRHAGERRHAVEEQHHRVAKAGQARILALPQQLPGRRAEGGEQAQLPAQQRA